MLNSPDTVSKDARTRFVIITTPRTGSNLLIDLLNSHPDCFSGHEIFSQDFIDTDHIPWYLNSIPNDRELRALRKGDPIKFMNQLFEITAKRGYRVIGFKLMYNEGDANRLVRDYLAADKKIRAIHIKRRNLLRRLVSQRRAEVTQKWWVSQTDNAGQPPPSIRLTPADCSRSFNYVEQKQTEYDDRFKDHEMLEVYYEDLAMDPRAVAIRVWDFLGLAHRDKVEIGTKKTGTDSLRDAIENYDELKAHAFRWSSFFDE